MILRIVCSTALAFSLISVSAPQASALSPNWDNCWGCNIVDGGQFTSSLVGRTVHYGDPTNRTSMVVQSVDYTGYRVYVRNTSTGSQYWVNARSVYDASNKEERNMAAGGAVVAGIIGALLAGGSSSNSSTSNSSSSNARYQCERRCEQTTHHYDPGRQAAAERQCKARC